MSNLTIVQPKFITMAKKGLVMTGNMLAKQSPIILAGTALIGVGTTGYLAYKAGLAVEEVLKNAEEEKGAPLTTAEKVQTGWKLWIPPVASGALTMGAIVASTAISEKRRAALATLYAASETALKEYQNKVEEVYGPRKEQAIRDQINADKVKNDTCPFDESQFSGRVLVKDRLSGRIFLGDVNKIRQEVCEMNERILAGDMCCSLNEFYESIDLDPIDLGTETGWSLSHLARIYFTSALTSDMRPILVMDWDRDGGPTADYRDI